MAVRVQRRRGTTAQHASFTGAEGELTVNTTTKRLHVHDGATAGGFAHALLGEVLQLAGGTLTGALTLAGDPTSALHAATKQYVDALIAGLDIKASVRLATAAALPANTRTGSVLNADANGALSVDGVAVALNDRVLVRAESSTAHNGIYTVTATGSAGAPWQLTRASDMDAWAEVPGSIVAVEAGSTLADAVYLVTADSGGTLNTTAISTTLLFSVGGAALTANNLSDLANKAAAVQNLFAADISPTQITADQNDYNPTSLSTATVLRLSTDALRVLTGLQGGGDGRALIVHNVGTNDLGLANESASSSAANRFVAPHDVRIPPNGSALIWYDATSSRWRVVSWTRKPPTRTPFVASGTWNKPFGCSAVDVEVKGGGGGGGGVSNASATKTGGGGAEGGLALETIPTASLGATETVTVGAGGTAGSTAGGNGGTGGTSSFGAHCSATGGAGGPGRTNGNTTPGALGGVGSGGDSNRRGAASTPGGGSSAFIGGGGGGQGGGDAQALISAAGIAGVNGGGGSGAIDNGTTGRAGGAGGDGYVMVREYY